MLYLLYSKLKNYNQEELISRCDLNIINEYYKRVRNKI